MYPCFRILVLSSALCFESSPHSGTLWVFRIPHSEVVAE